MNRLNSDKFFDFLKPFYIIFSMALYDRTHQSIEKKPDFFRIFLNIPDFFSIFDRFLRRASTDNFGQLWGTPQKIRLEKLHLLSYVSEDG